MGSPVVSNIIYGPVAIWEAPTGEAEPDETSVSLGDAWGGNWARVGFTKAPLTALYDFETAEAMTEEHLTAVKRWKSAESFTVETVLAELIADYLALVAGTGTVTTTASGAGQVGFEELPLGGERVLTEKAIGFEGTYRDSAGASFPVRLFIHKATLKINGPLEFSKADYPGIAFQAMALADPSQSAGEELFKFQRVTAAAS